MKNKFIAPNTKMVNASNVLDNSGVFKPTKRENWSLQRKVPREILTARAEKEARQKIQQYREEATARLHAMHPIHANLPKGLHATTVNGGFKVLGFGVTVSTREEVIALAHEHKRDFVKIDGVTAV